MEDKNKKANRKGCYKNTTLCCYLKTILRSDRMMKAGKDYQGMLRRDVETDEFLFDEHFSFVETLPQVEKRNLRVFDGKYITVTRRDDGLLRLNFKSIKSWVNFNIADYAINVGNEIYWALDGLIEKVTIK